MDGDLDRFLAYLIWWWDKRRGEEECFKLKVYFSYHFQKKQEENL
jgi:hypothetical protein